MAQRSERAWFESVMGMDWVARRQSWSGLSQCPRNTHFYYVSLYIARNASPSDLLHGTATGQLQPSGVPIPLPDRVRRLRQLTLLQVIEAQRHGLN